MYRLLLHCSTVAPKHFPLTCGVDNFKHPPSTAKKPLFHKYLAYTFVQPIYS